MLTIVSTMKPMIDPFIIEQTNSVISWKKLSIKPDIIIFGNDIGVKEFCEKHNIKHIENVKTSDKGTPLISDIINRGYELMKTEYIMYINADILLMDDFSYILIGFHNSIGKNVNSCLLTGIRYDVKEFQLLDFDNKNWTDDVKNNFRGEYAHSDAIDYFVHKINGYKTMPEFAIARYVFDSWMLDYGIKNFDISIDITNVCKVYHHFGKYFQEGKVCERNYVSPTEVEKNKKLSKNEYQLREITNIPYYLQNINNQNGCQATVLGKRYNKLVISSNDTLFMKIFDKF
jgi:hypothetical protein